MNKEQREMNESTFTTTLGELICAISEAAKEARVADEDLSTITHLILRNVLDRSKQ